MLNKYNQYLTNTYNQAKDVAAWRRKHGNLIYTFDRDEFIPDWIKSVPTDPDRKLKWITL